MAWSSDALRILRDAIGAGLTYGQASRRLALAGYRYSRNACIGKAGREKLVQTREAKPAKPKPDPRPANPKGRSRPSERVDRHPLASASYVGDDRVEVTLNTTIASAPVRLVELDDKLFSRCRFPVDGVGADLVVCGAETISARAEAIGLAPPACAPYCVGHHLVAYRPAEKALQRIAEFQSRSYLAGVA